MNQSEGQRAHFLSRSVGRVRCEGEEMTGGSGWNSEAGEGTRVWMWSIDIMHLWQSYNDSVTLYNFICITLLLCITNKHCGSFLLLLAQDLTRLGWTQIHTLPASPFWVLRLSAWTITPNSLYTCLFSVSLLVFLGMDSHRAQCGLKCPV